MANEINNNNLIVKSISISGTEYNSTQWNSAFTTLHTQSAGWGGTESNISPIISTFTLDLYPDGNAIWVKPAGAKRVKVTAVGGGGGGGSGEKDPSAGNTARGGGGGGGGGHSSEIFNADDLTNTVLVSIGSGGMGGSNISSGGSPGLAGSSSKFGSVLLAQGGAGGRANVSTDLLQVILGGFGGAGDINGSSGGSAAYDELTGYDANDSYKSAAGGGFGGTRSSSSTIAPRYAGVNLRIFTATDAATADVSGKSVTDIYNLNDLSYYGGCGGGGGTAGNSTSTNGLPGKSGGLYGGGGGGGGGAVGSANAAGSGGAGAHGIVVVTTYF